MLDKLIPSRSQAVVASFFQKMPQFNIRKGIGFHDVVELIIDFDQFEDANSTSVPSAVAFRTAHSMVDLDRFIGPPPTDSCSSRSKGAAARQ